jgi:hypothetical protein
MVVARHVGTPEAEDCAGHKERETNGAVSVHRHLRSEAIYNCHRNAAHRALLLLLVKFIFLEPLMLRQIRLLPAPGCNVSRNHFLLDQGVPMIMCQIHTGRRFNLHREASGTIEANEGRFVSKTTQAGRRDSAGGGQQG